MILLENVAEIQYNESRKADNLVFSNIRNQGQ